MNIREWTEKKGSSTDTSPDLVQQARAGDRDAYGELVRLHRARAYRWAQRMAGDAHLAEDIVQDALVRAFLKLGTLLDESRFLPWLRRIVSNEVRMKMRRGGPRGRERPATGWRDPTGSEGVNPSNMEEILDWLRFRKDGTLMETEPEAAALRRETLETIRVVLRCLSHRERELFEAHFFRQLAPGEIADLLSMSRGNVYTSLHRVKEKVRREGFRLTLQPYLHNRKEKGHMSQKQLRKPVLNGRWNSGIASLEEALRYTHGTAYDYTELMGYTGQAFRIQVHPGDVDVAGPTAYPWKNVWGRGLSNIGVRMGYCGAEVPTYEPPTAEEVMEAIRRIHGSIDRGVPVIAWDLFIPEFGLIYGYDDGKRELDALDYEDNRRLPYDRLGRGRLKELALFTLEKREAVTPRASLAGALHMALDHGKGKETPIPGYVQGPQAYEVWAEAFRSGEVNPFGNAYNAAVYSDARQSAAQFLLRWCASYPEPGTTSDEQVLLARAAVCYARVNEALVRVRSLFPFPSGGDPKNPEDVREAIRCLDEAREAEKEGLEVLGELAGKMAAEGVAE
ncbi:RNA polymerase sigma factor [Melghirimyces profundicolus]|uniref:RNA polymerase sigma factor n=1 Tax=Melghirimyces profundicolus TaxID=1242148 RepID=UPI001472C521|nr:RNA polymerase sigma factor [Melghirimyces profundicolus]